MHRELIAWLLIPCAFLLGLWVGHRFYSMRYLLRSWRSNILDFFR